MNDVAYRLNTALPIKAANVVVNNGSRSNLIATASGSVFYRGNQISFVNESVPGTGLVNRFDDPTYYSA